jgi:hypothetical protein
MCYIRQETPEIEMSDAKTFERAVRAAWDEIRAERRASRRLLSSADLAQSAARLRGIAESLEALAAQASQAEAAAPANSNAEAAPKPKAKAKRKPKKAAPAKAAKKSKKK